jgi:DNA-binding Xre family transcriptional regulator
VTRVLKSKLKEKLQELLRKHDLPFVAASIGIAPNTLRKMLREDWDFLPRDAIERICDRFDCSLDELFELVPDKFWTSIAERKQCTFLRAPSGESQGKITRDHTATTTVTDFLHDSFPPFTARTLDNLHDESTIIESVKGENCIVIGRTNRASEILLSRLFNAIPFDARPTNGTDIPFFFVVPNTDPLIGKSSLVRSTETAGPPGIYLKGSELLIPADFWPEREFFNLSFNRARDPGLILVVDKPFDTNLDVKLVVLAGFSGIGTLAAAKALVRDFRDLEPVPPATHVLGVVQGVYRKTKPDVDNRELLAFHWKYLIGGRKRILPPKKTRSEAEQ